MNIQTAKGKLVTEYCSKFPETKDYTLAKKIKKENFTLFTTVEQVRSFIRDSRGHKGDKSRRTAKTLKPLTYDTSNTPKSFKEVVNTGAKILILDIETAPGRGYFWDVWQQNINMEMITNDWFMLTWSAKWLFEKKVYSGKLTSKEAIAQDDKRISKAIWELLNEADLVIAHNGDKFDIPRINTRFITHGISPPLPYQSIDTLRTIRRQFAFFHNKLDYVNDRLHLTRKAKNSGIEMWKKCYAGDIKALTEMEGYNIQDVYILEETYLKLRPWIRPHPNVGLFILDEHASHCPTCGSADLKDEGKEYYTTANAYSQYRCNNCSSVGRKRLSSLNIKQKRNLLLSVAK